MTTLCRRMRRAELDAAMAWAAEEGWNPGPQDAACFWAADPDGFWCAVRDGDLAASISLVRYDEGFGFLGLYIARPEARGQGLGLQLWNAALAGSPARCIGLDGVVAQQANYRRSGFALAHRNIRYGGARPAGLVAPKGVVAAASLPFAQLGAYDRTGFPAPREAFLRAWIAAPGHVALAVVRDGALAGYGVVRPCPAGAKIGPLFAEDADVAETLFTALLVAAPEGQVFLDLAEPHRAAVAMAEGAGMAPVFETARMYRGPAPGFDAQKVWGITTFELG